jgi:hypothetical protein
VTGRVRHHEKAQRRAGWRPTQGQDVRPGLVPHTLKPFWVNPAMQAPQVLSSTPVSQDSRFKLVQTSSDVPSQLAVHAPHPPRDGTAEHTYPPHLPQPKSMLQSSANENSRQRLTVHDAEATDALETSRTRQTSRGVVRAGCAGTIAGCNRERRGQEGNACTVAWTVAAR